MHAPERNARKPGVADRRGRGNRYTSPSRIRSVGRVLAHENHDVSNYEQNNDRNGYKRDDSGPAHVSRNSKSGSLPPLDPQVVVPVDSPRVRVVVLITGIAIVAGIVLSLTVGSLIGPILIVGGVAGLLVAVLPAAIDSIARLLSTGLRR